MRRGGRRRRNRRQKTRSLRRWHLVLAYARNDKSAASTLELVEAESTIGRHPDCDLVVDSGPVSRFHCKITKHENTYFLTDLGSRNGTYLGTVRK